ncbi:MAG: type II toxin-antitoxin system HicB family antitoxin [Thermacetogeniaceae bacterium]
MAKDRYIYPAIFDYSEDGISVEFPDLPGCYTCGNDEEEALQMAKEALALHIYGLEEEGFPIPEPSPANKLKVGPNQVVVLVEAWMPPFRDEMKHRAVKKTLTIPKWLDDLAREHNVNFSHLLQNALKKYLGVNDEQP